MTTDNPLLKTYFVVVNAQAKPICFDSDMNFMPSVAYHPATISYFDTLAEALYAITEYGDNNPEYEPRTVSFVVGKTEAKIYS